MKIKCCGVSGGVAPGHSTVTYIVGEQIAIDAGSICRSLSIEEQAKIEAIFITHAHIDHLMDLCFFADNILTMKTKPVEVFGSETTIEYINKYLFNNKMWPDFTRIKNAGKTPVLEFKVLPDEVIRYGVKIQAVKVNHDAGAVGYIATNDRESWIFSGDTGPTDEIWEIAHTLDNLRGILIDISFPNKLEAVAKKSRHLTPKMFLNEYKKLPANVPVYIHHIKPKFHAEVVGEIKALKISNVSILESGQLLGNWKSNSTKSAA